MRLTDADAVKLGGSDVSSIYLGAVAVWGGGVRLAQYTFDTTSQSWAVSTGAWYAPHTTTISFARAAAFQCEGRQRRARTPAAGRL